MMFRCVILYRSESPLASLSLIPVPAPCVKRCGTDHQIIICFTKDHHLFHKRSSSVSQNSAELTGTGTAVPVPVPILETGTRKQIVFELHIPVPVPVRVNQGGYGTGIRIEC